jgi:hypothetical protein
MINRWLNKLVHRRFLGGFPLVNNWGCQIVHPLILQENTN